MLPAALAESSVTALGAAQLLRGMDELRGIRGDSSNQGKRVLSRAWLWLCPSLLLGFGMEFPCKWDQQSWALSSFPSQ